MNTYITVTSPDSAELILKSGTNKFTCELNMKELAKLYEEALSSLRFEASYQEVDFMEFVNKLLEKE